MVAVIKYAGVLLLLAAVADEFRWTRVPASVDDLTGNTVPASVFVQDTERLERVRSLFLISNHGENGLLAIISLSQIDRFPVTLGGKEVSISYRADGGELQKETDWFLEGPRTASRKITPDEARELFSGDFIIVSVDKTGKRYRYEFGNRDGLMEAVEEIIDSATAE